MKLPSLPYDGRILPRSEEGSIDVVQYGTAVLHKVTRTLVARSSSTCEPGNTSDICQKPVSTNTQTLPIVLGVVYVAPLLTCDPVLTLPSIPVCAALIVFIYLHRRNKQKQALEDLNDPHKSLDFGVVSSGPPGARRKGRFGGGRQAERPEMMIPELGPDPMRPGKKRGGLSMDMLGSPYLLPSGLQGSDGSLHSMSRAVHDQHDPYRPVTLMRDSGETSRSPRPFNENGSMYSNSTFHAGNDKSTLVANAQPPSTSFPSRGDSMSKDGEEFSLREMHSSARGTSVSRKTSFSSSAAPTLANISESGSFQYDIKKDSLPPLPPPPEPESFEQHVPPPRTTSISINRPPRKSSVSHNTTLVINRTSDASFYGDEEPPPPPPKMMEPEDWSQGPLADEPAVVYAGRFSIDTGNPSQQFPVENNRLSVMPGNPNRLSVMGMRPLPPEDPADNPEQRANRIRSFYKEYFDDSRPNPQNAFYEDWDPAYLETAIYDPETGEYIYPNAVPQAPFMQPMGRRAMTPPPGGFGRPPPMDHVRHYSTMSGGRAPFGGRPGPGPRQPPKKKLPPPKPLMSLPTPSKLGTDEALYMAADLAPPTSFREIQNGRRPDSPMGIQRPYSPQVKAFSPLVPSFDELSAMPSPHHLRKSGTFSNLDFAPPRFRGAEGRDSDAGSIRSARSGISAMQLNAVREGAYRVSRIPKEFVTSRDDMTQQLRPKLDMISRA